MPIVIDAKLVEDRVAVLRVGPRALRVPEVEAADEHELAVSRVLAVLEALARVGRAIESTA